jgi:acetyl esterase/lipase
MLARELAQAGVPCQMKVVEGVVHGFMQMSSELPEALSAFQDAAAFTRSW